MSASARRLLALLVVVACRDPDPAPRPVRASPGPAQVKRARVDAAGLLRMDGAQVGCWMERTFGHRDPRWNCSTRLAAPEQDPCADGFDAGPRVPAEVARRVHPLLRDLELDWEHGALQRAVFRFDPTVAAGDLPGILGLSEGPDALDEAAAAGPGACDTPCYEVLAFESDDTDCEGGAADDDDADP